MTSLNGIYKSRNVINTEILKVNATEFAVVTYGYEAEVKEIWTTWADAFELWFLEKTIESTKTVGRLNESIVKEVNPDCSLEVYMLELK